MLSMQGAKVRGVTCTCDKFYLPTLLICTSQLFLQRQAVYADGHMKSTRTVMCCGDIECPKGLDLNEVSMKVLLL